jgi:hypothetical protein
MEKVRDRLPKGTPLRTKSPSASAIPPMGGEVFRTLTAAKGMGRWESVSDLPSHDLLCPQRDAEEKESKCIQQMMAADPVLLGHVGESMQKAA